MGRKVGIFSGSFNPIHNGHIAIARYMLEKEDLDEIWFIASPQNPLKSHDALLDDATRAHMVQLAIGDNPKLRYCDIEMHLPRPSYTITTLEALTRQNPDVDFVLLIGSDNWAIFDRWKSAKKIIAHYPIYIYPRPGCEVDATTLPSRVHLTQAPMMEISSTGIRALIANGQSTAGLLPQPVEKYIKEHKLYTHILK